MAKSELELEGEVLEILPNQKYRVKLDQNSAEVLCHPCGRMRTNNIRMIRGDKVTVALSEYDLNRGIIKYRKK